MSDFTQPHEVTQVEMAFGGGTDRLMPKMSDIPDEFKSGTNVWARWQANWFYGGLDHYPVANDGIDLGKAMRHLKTIQGSFTPKHEHKQAAVAYLASLWFTSPDGELIPT